MDATTNQIMLLIGTIVAGGLGVNLVAQLLKKAFNLRADAVIHTLVISISFVIAGAQYVMRYKSQLPPEILGVSATAIYGFSQATFKYAKITSSFLARVRAAEALLDAQNAPVAVVSTPETETMPTTATANTAADATFTTSVEPEFPL